MTLEGKMELQPDQKKLLEFIENANGKISLLHNKALCKAFLNNLNSEQIGELHDFLEKNIKAVGGASPGRMEQLQKTLSEGNFSETLINCLPVQRCYLYWKKTLDLLTEFGKPATVGYVSEHLHICWATARALLFRMSISGKIVAVDTSMGYLFSVKSS